MRNAGGRRRGGETGQDAGAARVRKKKNTFKLSRAYTIRYDTNESVRKSKDCLGFSNLSGRSVSWMTKSRQQQ